MKIRFLTFSLALIAIFVSCQRPRPAADPAEYARFISGYTTGVISTQDVVRIRLNQATTIGEPGKEITEGVFNFDPLVKGKAYLISGSGRTSRTR